MGSTNRVSEPIAYEKYECGYTAEVGCYLFYGRTKEDARANVLHALEWLADQDPSPLVLWTEDAGVVLFATLAGWQYEVRYLYGQDFCIFLGYTSREEAERQMLSFFEKVLLRKRLIN